MDRANPSEADDSYLPKVTQLPEPTPPSRQLDALDNARTEGRAFVWGGLGIAALWWIAAYSSLFITVGSGRAAGMTPALLLAISIAIAVPGFVIVLAGLLARAHARAAASNAVVLQAAARLLSPLEVSGKEAQTFADQMKASASQVDRSMAHALSSMKAMSGEISDERQKLEAVSSSAAENAELLSQRLKREREALERLAADIQHQTELMSEAIPRQAEQMRDSARQAATDLAEADQDLETRLGDLRQTSSDLTDRVSTLDEMSVEATKRGEALIFAVSRMEEKLEQSRKMVDQALRASEMVAASASTTGDRITEAVSAAMENARSASRDIQDEARQAAEQAAESLAALKRAGEEAAETVRKAREDADALAAFQSIPPQPRQAPDDRTDQKSTDETRAFHPEASSFTYQFRGRSEDDVFDEGSEPAEKEPLTSNNSSASADGDLFDGNPETPAPAETKPASREQEQAQANGGEAEREPSAPIPLQRRRRDRTPSYLKPVGGSEAVNFKHDEDEDEQAEAREDIDEAAPEKVVRDEPAKREHWSNILADLSEDERPGLPREENAEKIIEVLMDSGIRLTELFRPRDKKKIAAAARKGDGQRRKTVVDIASRQVQRVQKHLDAENDLMMMAREFLAVEESDALMALDKTSHSSKNASARLSAFLLIDAAMG